MRTRTTTPPSTSPGLRVTAVLVTFDAGRWLPATLDTWPGCSTGPTRLIAIDNDSADGTRTC